MTVRHKRRRVLAELKVTALGATVTALVLLAVPVTAVGATTAQPGESLYGVKRGLEQVRLAFALGPERGAKVHVDLAATRLGELTGLIGNDASPTMIADVSHALEEHAAAASAGLDGAPDTPDRSRLQRRLSAVASQQAEVMGLALAGCADAAPGCQALEQTHEETVALRDATTSDAPAVLAGEVSARPENPAQADAQASATPSAPAVAAAVDGEAPAGAGVEPPPDAADPDDQTSAREAEAAADGPAVEPPPDPVPSTSPAPGAGGSPSETPSPSESASPSETTSPSESASSDATPRSSTAEEPDPTPSRSSSPRTGSRGQGGDAPPDVPASGGGAGGEPATDDTGAGQ